MSSSRSINSNSSSSNSNNSSSTRPVFSAFRPEGVSPSKQELPELKEYQDAFNKLLDKEEQILTIAAESSKLEDKLNALNALSLEYHGNAGQSRMMANQLRFPLNKTFFNVFKHFQERAISLQIKIRAIKYWRDGFVPRLESVKLINEFPENEAEIASLRRQLDNIRVGFYQSYQKMQSVIGNSSNITSMLEEKYKQYKQVIENEINDKLKKINENFGVAQTFAASSDAGSKKKTNKSSTKRIRQSLGQSAKKEEADNDNESDSEGQQKEKFQRKSKRTRPDENSSNKKMLSKFYVSSQDFYNNTQSQNNDSQEAVSLQP